MESLASASRIKVQCDWHLCVLKKEEGRHTKGKTAWIRLYLDLALDSLLDLPLVGLGLGAHDTTTPVPLGLLVLLHVALLDGLDELAEVGLVFAADLGDGECGCGLEKGMSVRRIW